MKEKMGGIVYWERTKGISGTLQAKLKMTIKDGQLSGRLIR